MARRTLLLVLAAALVLVPATAAGTVQDLAKGDTVDVVGTKIACFVLDGPPQGIGCYLSTNKGLTKGTYGIAISQTGDTIVTKVNSRGGTTTLWGSRKKASARVHATRYFRLEKGDNFGFRVGLIDTGCAILNLTNKDARYSGLRVVCFRSKKSQPLPSSYGVVLSNKFAGSFRFDAKGNPGPTTYRQFQPTK